MGKVTGAVSHMRSIPLLAWLSFSPLVSPLLALCILLVLSLGSRRNHKKKITSDCPTTGINAYPKQPINLQDTAS